jgi:hypothetical protein
MPLLVTTYSSGQKTKEPAEMENGILVSFKDDNGDIVPLLAIRDLGGSTGLANLKIKQGAALESPAYDASDTESNGYVSLLWLNDENRVQFGTGVDIGDELSLPDNPELINFINFLMDYAASQGTVHGPVFSVNYEAIFAVIAEADGSGGIQNKGTLNLGTRYMTDDSKTIGPGSWRERIDGEDLVVEKFNGNSWIEVTRHTPPADPPQALNVAASGDVANGSVLTGTFDYYDLNGDVETTSTYQWYAADDDEGLNEAAISGATALTYTTVVGDVGKYIRIGITPVNATSSGTEAFSGYIGAIT